jgi:hypothetical protein
MARPTDYNQEIVEKTKEYIKTYEMQGDMIPSIEGLSAFIEVNRSTIYRWAAEEGKEEFKDTLEDLNAKQKRVLLNKGLSGDFNSNITKLALGNHGMSEKNQTELKGAIGIVDLSDKTDEELAAIINGTQ